MSVDSNVISKGVDIVLALDSLCEDCFDFEIEKKCSEKISSSKIK